MRITGHGVVNNTLISPVPKKKSALPLDFPQDDWRMCREQQCVMSRPDSILQFSG